jgi:hypothetical protein
LESGIWHSGTPLLRVIPDGKVFENSAFPISLLLDRLPLANLGLKKRRLPPVRGIPADEYFGWPYKCYSLTKTELKRIFTKARILSRIEIMNKEM